MTIELNKWNAKLSRIGRVSRMIIVPKHIAEALGDEKEYTFKVEENEAN